MQYLIVNGDDFGASRGINRGIVELYERGVLTSTSMMIAMPAAADAVRLARQAPGLGIGLHVTLTDEATVPLVDFDDGERCAQMIAAQVDVFCDRFGRLPTHLDSHQNVHRDQRLRPLFEAAAFRYSLPLREHSPVRYFSNFYGQWDGDPHPEQISIGNLLRMLDFELRDGITELSCHPGYAEPAFASPYNHEREIELQTLSDPKLLEFLDARGVLLINFGDVPSVVGSASSA